MNLKLLKLLSAFLLVFVVQQSRAAGGSIKGKIVDENGLTMPGATILLMDIDGRGDISNDRGEFTIFDIPEGTHQVHISYIGYKDIEQDIEVTPGGVADLKISLEPGVIMGDDVLVLGDRLKGQAKALNDQRTKQNITNIVASDQIGRFPDANIGDAVKRIPGITMQNDQGEARNIIIRGMAPQLNSVTINGERIPSAEGDNRNIQMDLIPADMVQTIEVNKAVTPEMDADAIGGSVNLVTRSAPDGLRVSGTFATGYNMISEQPSWTGGLVLGNRFLNNKLGAVLSVSYNNRKFGSDNIEGEWENEVESPISGEDIEVDPYLGEMDIRQYEVQRIRRSVSLNLDYKINPKNTIYVQSMYNWRDDWENRYRLTYRSIEPTFADGTENITGWTAEARRQTKGGVGSDRVDNRRLEDQRVRFISVGGDHIFGNVTMDWSASYAKASENRPNERYIRYESDDAYGINMDLSDTRFPVITSPDGSLNNPNLFVFDELTKENQETYEENLNARLNFELPVSLISSQQGKLKFGGKIRDKEKVRANNFFSFEATDANPTDFSLMANLPYQSQSKTDFSPGSQYAAGNFVTREFLGSQDLDNATLFDKSDEPSEYLADNYSAKETVTAGYVQFSQDFTDEFTVLVGARFENTAIEYTGNDVENEEDLIGTITQSDSYSNIMPGVHVKYNVFENTILRLAWTNTLARPNYYDLVPYYNFVRDDDELSIGNPNLKPTTSMNLDFNVENYFKSIGLVSAGFFYKNIDGFIYTQVTEETIDGVPDVEVYQPVNGGKGSVTGTEISFQRQLDFLPGILKGLGVYVNYTYTKSNAEGFADGRDELGLPGVAENMFNGSLSFETKKLVIRASVNYSSDYVDEVGSSAFSDRYYDQQFFLDMNASYAFTPMWRIFFEANNLTNQPLRYYQGSVDRTMQLEYYQARFNLGVKFDMFKN